MKLEVYDLKKEDENAWDAYIHKSSSSTFYHQLGWRNVVKKTYKHKPIYLVAKENDEIKGVLPLFLMKSMIFGKKLVSVPFAPYGGVCADNETIENALIEEAKRITEECGVDYLELRNLKPNELGLATNDGYFALILELNQNPDVLWEKFRKSMRRYVRKAIKNNFQVTINSKKVKDFYNLYLQSMHNLGTPAHSYTFFRNILLEYQEDTNIATVEYKDKVISTIFLLYFKNIVIYGWGASLKEYLELSPNYLLFWETIKHSCEKGFNFFDFGRSQPNTGVFLFKEGWGAEPKQLYYQYYLNNVNKMPDTGQLNPKRKKFAKVWNRLPISLANKMGPILRSNFP